MKIEILRDLIAVATDAYPPPAFSDEAAVATWVGKLASACVPVVYDVFQSAPQALSGFAAEDPPTAAEIEQAYKCNCDACGGYSKLGDGKILAWLQSVNWAQLVQTIVTIISIIPKTPAA